MAGKCVPYTTVPEIRCVQLGENNWLSQKSTNNPRTLFSKCMCTKVVLIETELLYHHLSAGDRKHFKDVRGHRNRMLSQCEVWKQTVCLGHGCQVKKEVKCRAVRKMAKGHVVTAQPGTCKEELCAG